MTQNDPRIEPVRHSVNVALSVDEAWRLFTAETGRWWPVSDSYSIHGAEVTGVEWEPRVGGEVREVTADGRTGHWAEVLAWEPPHRLVLAWRAGAVERPATEVEVRFAADGEGTRVELEHRGWDRLGADGGALRESYFEGWPLVIGRFEALASSSLRTAIPEARS